MELLLVRHLWGVTLPPAIALPRFRGRGYGAIEAPLQPQGDALWDLLPANSLQFVAMIFTTGDSVAALIKSFREQATAAVKCGARQITAHTGRDDWSIADAREFYREVTAIEADLPIAVGHETHRGRAFFNPWVTRDILVQFPSLKLCCDFSHWVCVAERLNWDDAAGSILELCAARVIHTHTRVGYEHGPQVPDPSAPEYAPHLRQHFEWWRKLWAAQKKRGDAVCTVTPEFGPPSYLHTLPHTNVPVADLEQVCEWTADRVKEVFKTHVV